METPTGFTFWGKKFIEELHNNVVHRGGVSGSVHPPKFIMLRQKVNGLYGHYSGWNGIRVWKYDNFAHMKATFLHECLHHVDGQSVGRKVDGMKTNMTRSRGHDYFWKLRLLTFKKMLKVKDKIIIGEP